MASARVYEIAKEFGVESKAVMAELERMGTFVRAASAVVEEPVVSRLRQHFAGKSSGATSGFPSSDRQRLSAAHRGPLIQDDRPTRPPTSPQATQLNGTQPALGFDELLRRLRRRAGMSQHRLAEAAGMSAQSVDDFERGATARKATAKRLADALGLAGHEREQFLAVASRKSTGGRTEHKLEEPRERAGAGPSFDRAAGMQVGSGNVQFNYFYGNPARTGASSESSTLAPGPQAPPAAGHAFISYIREDSDEVDGLQDKLEAAGIPVWRDTASLWPGEDWRAKIRSAITRDALVFIACFSSRSAARQKSYQNEELLLAIDQLRLRRPEDRVFEVSRELVVP